MSIVNDTSFSFNKQFKYNFNGGELSSDGGLFLLKEFASRIGFEKVIRDNFQTNDPAVHKPLLAGLRLTLKILALMKKTSKLLIHTFTYLKVQYQKMVHQLVLLWLLQSHQPLLTDQFTMKLV